MWLEYIKRFDIEIDLRDMGENLQQQKIKEEEVNFEFEALFIQS